MAPSRHWRKPVVCIYPYAQFRSDIEIYSGTKRNFVDFAIGLERKLLGRM